MTKPPPSAIGRSCTREDSTECLAGESRYVDDLQPPGLLYGAARPRRFALTQKTDEDHSNHEIR